MKGLARLSCFRLQPRAYTVAAQLVSESTLSSHKTSSIEREVRRSESLIMSGLGSFSPCMPFSASASRLDSGTGASTRQPCWSCQSSSRTPDTLFCSNCGALQQVDKSQSYFRLMGVREGEFKLDDSLLDRQYKYLQRQLHPDKFANKSEAEKERSAEASSLINEAFSSLKSPLRRAEYLLQQRGIEATEGTVEDPELLMGIMAAREAVESADNKEELQRFSQTFEQQASNCILGITDAFQDHDMEKAQALVTLLRYVTRIQTAILEKL